MARFDIYPGGDAARFLLDVQSNHLESLPTRTVVPLAAPGGALPHFRDLTPSLTVAGERVVMLTPLIGAIPRRALGKPIGNLTAQADDITRALDILLTGF